MSYIAKVEAARRRQQKSFRARVEAKYKIMEVVKKAARNPTESSDGSGLQPLAEEFKTILTSLDTYVKKSQPSQIAVNTK